MPGRYFGLFALLFILTLEVCASGSGLARRDPALTGDTQCQTYMCVSATVNGSTVEYVMSSTTSVSEVGWMGIGFGASMIDVPMVIMWANSDGNVTLSQRSASSYAEPTVTSNPPRVATALTSLSTTSGSITSFVFSVPVNSDTLQNVIFGISTTAPSSSEQDADLAQHNWNGMFTLDLTKTISASATISGDIPQQTSSSSSGTTIELPLLPYQRLIVAHAVFCSLGFVVFLPAGSLLARYLRTFTPVWFKGHWIIQFGFAGPISLIGIALGIQSVSESGGLHLDDTHKKMGLAIFVLYLFQCSLGYVIHRFKPQQSKSGQPHRPIQNYAHAIVGLLIISLALAQVRNGLVVEWPNSTARGEAPAKYRVWWIVWAVLLPVLYTAGLFFLPRQLRQETEPAQKSRHIEFETRGSNGYFDSSSSFPQVAGDYHHYHP